MKIITHKDILNLDISPAQCLKWVEYMLANKSNSFLPAKISMKQNDGIFCNVMPSIVCTPAGSKKGGVKVVTRYPSRNPALDSKIILFDAESGNFEAILDGNWITSMRTGAVAAHSILLFAKKGFLNIGILGLGNSARAALMVLASQVKDRELKVKLLKYKGQEILFAERFKEYKNLSFSYVDSPEELVKGSEVLISAATYLPENVCEDKYFDEGILLVPIHTLGFTNCDLFFDKVFADDYNHVSNFKYFDKFKSFAEVSDVVCGKAAGRTGEKERIIAYNIGIAVHDLFFASNIYSMLNHNKLQNIDFLEPTEKFWI